MLTNKKVKDHYRLNIFVYNANTHLVNGIYAAEYTLCIQNKTECDKPQASE